LRTKSVNDTVNVNGVVTNTRLEHLDEVKEGNPAQRAPHADDSTYDRAGTVQPS
jgi:hypothetical protein